MDDLEGGVGGQRVQLCEMGEQLRDVAELRNLRGRGQEGVLKYEFR